MRKTLKEMTLDEKLNALGFANEEPAITETVYDSETLSIYEIVSDPGGAALDNAELEDFLQEKSIKFDIDENKKYYIKYFGTIIDSNTLFYENLLSYCESIECVKNN